MDIHPAGTPIPHSSHWGAFSVIQTDGGIRIVPHSSDPDPASLLGNIPAALTHRARIATPMVRKGWLDDGPGPDRRRGRDKFIPLPWPEALELTAAELKRIYTTHGSGAVFGGSYGWSSAGRFHHAQSQVHRFLKVLGGYVKSVNTYSSAAAAVISLHRAADDRRDRTLGRRAAANPSLRSAGDVKTTTSAARARPSPRRSASRSASRRGYGQRSR